ncbi:MAG: hypothetical protein L3J28_06085, partial [Candidatus Polarisedimenticolaceae bacterium]|nr:hypothetical protein [Candidatus Polarisedimenticolaceae bacterium]
SLSVGFRAPALRDLTAAWCDELIEQHVPKQRYRDPELPLQSNFTEITTETTAKISQLMQQFLQQDEAALQRWFGRYVTETKENLRPEPVEATLESDEFYDKFQALKKLTRDNYSRMLFARNTKSDLLFANGEAFELAASEEGFLQIITQQTELQFDDLKAWLDEPTYRALLTTLYNQGCFFFTAEE